MDYLHAANLAIIQGLTEFLPVSSSGHLVIVDSLLTTDGSGDSASRLTVNIVLHAGTLLAVLVVYWHRIWRLLGTDAQLIGKLLVGTLPASVVGLTIKKYFPGLAEQPLLTGAMLIVTGGLLLWGARRPVGSLDYPAISYRQALLIGLVQALAILPGISRSGATIVAGLAVGLRRDAAATFSFFLAIPVIGGATLLEGIDLASSSNTNLSLGPLLLGLLIAFLVGWAALRFLLQWLQQGKLHHFAWWCIPLGVVVVAWQILG